MIGQSDSVTIRASDSNWRDKLNPYADIIVKEALRRGITVDMLDTDAGYFRLTCGAQSIVCRESLSERTSAIAMDLCDDKSVTLRFLDRAGVSIPEQIVATDEQTNKEFLRRHQSVVVKPACGEQGDGVSVDIDQVDDMEHAIAMAREIDETVLIENFVSGEDLRIIVIDFAVVAAAVRRSPRVIGDGRRSILELIKAQSSRRENATDGESHIPTDEETQRCVEAAGYEFSSVLEKDEALIVREAHNVHVGGTIEDVTAVLHPHLRDMAVRAARAVNIPVVGVDMIAPAVDSDEYVVIELNERPGLANHEPQPTAQRFIDFLFPATAEH